MLIPHFNNHILSDNALFNFGMVDGNVVIIDAGSRFRQPELSRSRFNTKVMKPFWIKAQTVIHPATLNLYREEWRVAGHDMVTALQTYETRWQELRNDRRSLSVLYSLEERNSTTAECPHVASVIDSLDTDTLDWLTQTYLWGEVAEYGPSSDGYTRQQDSSYTAAQKLEQLISETHEQRVIHCNNPAEDILNEDELKVILDAWKMIMSNGCAQKYWIERGTCLGNSGINIYARLSDPIFSKWWDLTKWRYSSSSRLSTMRTSSSFNKAIIWKRARTMCARDKRNTKQA